MTTRIFRLFLLIAILQSVFAAPPPTEDKEVTDKRKQFSTFEVKQTNPDSQKDDVQKRPVRDYPPKMDHDIQFHDQMNHEHRETMEQKPAVLPINIQNDPPRNNRDTASTTEKNTSKESDESYEDGSSEEKTDESMKNKPVNQKRENNPQEKVDQHHPTQKDAEDSKPQDSKLNRQRRQLLSTNKQDQQSTTPSIQSQNHEIHSMTNLDDTRKTRETEQKPQGDQPKPAILPAYQKPQTLPAKLDDSRKTRETNEQKPQSDQPKPEAHQQDSLQKPMTLPAPLDETRKTRETEQKSQGDQPKPATLPAYQRPQTLPAKLDENRKTRETEQKPQGDQPKVATLPSYQKPRTLPAKLDENRKTRETEQKPQADQPRPATLPIYQKDVSMPDNKKPPLDVNRQTRNTEAKPQNDQSKPIPEPIYPQLTYPAPVDKTRKTRETENTSGQEVGKVVLQKDDTLLLKKLPTGQTDGKVSEQKREVEKEEKHDMEGVQSDQSKDYHPKEIQVKEEMVKGQRQKRETTNSQSHIPSRENSQSNPQIQPVGPVAPEVLEDSMPKRPVRENDPKDLEHPQAAHDFLAPPKNDEEHKSTYPNYSPPSQRNSNVPQASVYRTSNEYRIPSDI